MTEFEFNNEIRIGGTLAEVKHKLDRELTHCDRLTRVAGDEMSLRLEGK